MSRCMLLVDLRYLPNVQTHFNSPQALLGLDLHFQIDVSLVTFMYPKELMATPTYA